MSDTGAAEPESSTVETPDGASLALRVLPVADPAAPVVLVLPAMAIKAKFYLPLLKALHEAGLSAATVDLRAQGDSTPALGKGPDFGYRALIETDLPAVVDALGKRFPQAPLHLFGHSLGGQLALLYSAAEPDRVTSVTTIGTGSVYWRAFPVKRWAEMLVTAQYVGLLTRLRGRWPGGGGIGPMTAGVMIDWARYARTGRFRPRGSTRKYDDLLREVSLPFLAISLDRDRLGPESTVRFLYGRLRSASITRWHIEKSSGLTHIGHAAWIKDSDKVAPVVAAWITEGKSPQ
ncbi:alpha/beta fold hydrolase [Amycolatopsis sp. GM8]|uniref:alpha/beta hydrolase family protein n=1 Tax=Amycolatopsis sp. GM8 TaxID=2896530 RepID=UPI001F20C885|nr:alpha/beta fold hydrolase [Amycolatopsis sp. GM8]